MLNLDHIKTVYFIGIGGIGMSALARYFKHLGCQVAGYDRTETPLTKELVQEGIDVIYEDLPQKINPQHFVSNPENLVVYTPAIPKELEILAAFKQVGIEIHKRSEVLGIISQGRKTIAIAGTHGKTTTSSMVAHILTDSGFGCSAFLGGITGNYHSNTLISDSEWVVVEADEYDRSFLTLHPTIAIVTSADADHLDIYGDHASMQAAFRQFLDQVDPDGTRIVHNQLPFAADAEYSADGEGQVHASNIRIEQGFFVFDYTDEKGLIRNIQMGIPGKHNIENAVAAIRVARELGIAEHEIKHALVTFKGVKRRFDYIFRSEGTIYIDDYAHHPQELQAFISAIRALYPEKKMTLIFQPHLFTRTRDFMEGFTEVLSQVDELWLMNIYPARELPIDGISSAALFEKCTNVEKHLMSEQEVLESVRRKAPELLLTVGAGDIDRLIEPLKEILNAN